ncbi:Structural maintenance of chromosomes protein 6 [Thecaphora frezii]
MSVLGKRLSDQGLHGDLVNGAASKRARKALLGDEDIPASQPEMPAATGRSRSSVSAIAQSGDPIDVEMALEALAQAELTQPPPDEEQERLDREVFEREEEEAHSMSELKAGAIEKVELINFMCHDHFSITLGPRLNIIIGQNGSGKSAILTAMTIALGAKASATSRASTLKTLVKHGRNQATVRIVLSNEGEEAFKPHLYGSKIIIERRIKADGPATWKLQDYTGKTVETTSAELHAICDQFSLQMDNPINVLTQDNARQFLQSNDPKKLYQLYYDGTQLSQLSKEVEIIKVNLNKMAGQLKQQERARDRLEENLQEAKRQWERVQAARGYQTKIDDLKDEMAWALVAEARQSLEAAVRRTEACREKRDSYQARLEACQEDLRKVGEQINALEEENRTRADSQAPLIAQREALKQRISAKRTEREEERAKEQTLARQKATLRSEIDDLQARIDAETAKLADDGRKRREALELRQYEVRKQLEGLEDEQAAKQQQLNVLEEQRSQVVSQLNDAEAEREDLRRKAETLDAHLRNLQASSRNSLAAFGGAAVPQLLSAIDRDPNWVRKPLGPLGKHLKLKDMRWAAVLESVIGNTLNAFFVTCHQDRARLERYLRQMRLHKSMVLTGSEELFDFSAGEPDPDVLTILRVLEIDNEIIKRQLVNSVHIERAALVPTRPDGDRLMRSKPRNVQNCFSGDLYSIRGGAVGSSSTVLNRHDGVPRFSQSNKAEMERVAQDRKGVETQLVQSNERIKQLVQTRADMDRNINAIKRQELPQLHRSIQELKHQLHAIADDLKEDEPANIRALEEAKEEAERAADENVEEFKSVQARKETIEGEMQKLEEERDRVRQQLEAYAKGTSSIEERILKATEERVKLSNNQEHWRGKVASSLARLEEAEREETEKVGEVDAMVGEAEQLCAEVATTRSADEIGREIDATKDLQRRASRETGIGVAQAERELEEAKERRDKGEEQYRVMHSLHVILQRASLKRWDKINEFKRSTAGRTKHLFTKHLQKRGYSGSLHFDHAAKTLSMSIRTNDRGRGNKMGDPKALSGGERSYTTTSLLLSLWQAIKSPIRCLDEFDVYMDTFNRKIALELLMAETTAYKNVQYILITPLELPGNINVDRE